MKIYPFELIFSELDLKLYRCDKCQGYFEECFFTPSFIKTKQKKCKSCSALINNVNQYKKITSKDRVYVNIREAIMDKERELNKINLGTTKNKDTNKSCPFTLDDIKKIVNEYIDENKIKIKKIPIDKIAIKRKDIEKPVSFDNYIITRKFKRKSNDSEDDKNGSKNKKKK